MPTQTVSLEPASLTLGVADLAQSQRFYGDLLGLPLEPVDDGLEVRVGRFRILLNEAPPAERGKFSFGFRVGNDADVDVIAERLRSANARVQGPEDRAGGRFLYVRDPDDYALVISSGE